MSEAKHETITVRVEQILDENLNKIAKEKAKPKSDIIRKAIVEFINKEKGIEEIKRFIAQKFAANKISFEDMAGLLGYKEAKKIAFYYEMAKDSFELGLE